MTASIGLYTVFAMTIALFVAVLVGHGVVAEAETAPVSAYEEWCDDRNGVLVNSNAVLHGGFHCQFQNGTSVHMADVEVGGYE